MRLSSNTLIRFGFIFTITINLSGLKFIFSESEIEPLVSVNAAIQKIKSSSDKKEQQRLFYQLSKISPSNEMELRQVLQLAETRKVKGDFESSDSLGKSVKNIGITSNGSIRHQISEYLAQGSNEIVLCNSAYIAGENKITEASDPLKQVIRRTSKQNKNDYLAASIITESSEALAKIGKKEDMEFLLTILPTDDRVAKGIAGFGLTGLNSTLSNRPNGFRLVILEMRHQDAILQLINLLDDKDENVRRVAASALSNYPHNHQIAEVSKSHLATEKHSWTRSELIKDVARHGGEEYIPFLLSLAKTERSYYAAIDGLGEIGGDLAKKALKELEHDPKRGEYAASVLNSILLREGSKR